MLVAACSDDDGADERDAAPTTTEVRFTGDAGSSFCSRLRDLDLGDALQDQATTPEDVAAGFGALLALLDELAGLAPEEVRGDVELLGAGIGALDEALAVVQYDWDALASSPQASAVAAATNDPAFTVAGDRLVAYRGQVCGLGG